MPIRYDRAPIKATKTPEGFVQDSPILSRVGIFEYRQPDGTVRKEYRPAEEVFHADHLASIAGKPITDEHHGQITGENAQGKLIGSTLSPGRQDTENPDNLRGDIVIHAAAATLTKRELSLGYSLDLDETPGEFNGVRYDAVQRNLRVNHLALVNKGRAGNARLNLDAADAVFVSTEEEDSMPTIKVRLDSAPGIEYDASPEVANHLTVQAAALTATAARADAAEAARDALQAQIDGHAAALTAAREDALRTAQARTRLEADAQGLGVAFAQDATDAGIRTAVIKHVRGDSLDLTGKSEAYVEAAYDLALADGKKAKANAGQNRAAVVAPKARQDGGDAPQTAASARDKMIANMTKTTTGA